MNTDGGREYSTFISHASADSEKARAIATSLEAKGLTCWIAPRDIKPGAEYADEIMRGIVQSKCFVLVLSEAANLSVHVRREVERAASHGKAIYPVRIEEVPPSPKLEYFIAMHHWLDAWDGVLNDHVDRLAAAINSQEEWIGNRVIKRRRLLFSGSLITLLAGAAVAFSLVFSEDLRRFTFAEDERARVELRELGISFDVDGLSRVAVTADAENLARFDRAGIGMQAIQAAFARPEVAEGFFGASRSRPEAIDWFRSVLERGFDPNATLPHSLYEREGMLATVLRAGNTEVALAMLEAGASPHVYQGLNFTSPRLPMSVFPFSHIESFGGFTGAEKARLAKAFVEAGAVVPLPAPSDDAEGSSARDEMAETRELLLSRYGVEVPVVSSICETVATRICQAASARTGFDWCGFAETLPKALIADEMIYNQFSVIHLNQLVNIADEKAYFLVSPPEYYSSHYGLLEISKDQNLWRLYRYIEHPSHRERCKSDAGYASEWCWREKLIEKNSNGNLEYYRDSYYDMEFCNHRNK